LDEVTLDKTRIPPDGGMDCAKRKYMPKSYQLSNKTKPRQVFTARWDALLTIYRINSLGGRVLAMAQVPGRNGLWKLLVNWPKSCLN
jgi:hypothetical protein